MLSRWQKPLQVASLRLAPSAAALVRRGGRSHPASALSFASFRAERGSFPLRFMRRIPLRRLNTPTFWFFNSVTLQLSHSATFPVC